MSLNCMEKETKAKRHEESKERKKERGTNTEYQTDVCEIFCEICAGLSSHNQSVAQIAVLFYRINSAQYFSL